VKKKIIILGSTGSIGKQTLEVVRKFPRDFEVLGLSGGKNWKLLKKQVEEFRPKFLATGDERARSKTKVKVLSLQQLATQKCDLIVSAISGVAGLAPTLAAIKQGRKVALANKESLVLAGDLLMREVKKSGAQILPIDSEHSGLWQLLGKVETKSIQRVMLTASGGALRDYPLAKLKNVSPKKVLQHPTWQMGDKITLDCATMANKAFEIIEAHHLFGIPYEKIEAVIHPQSLVHAMVETVDGNIFAQLSNPDMRLPIQLALFESERKESLIQSLDLVGKNLEFRKIERKRYPLFYTILAAAKRGGLAPVVAAAASEAAGKRFLAGEISFLEIEKLTKRALGEVPRKSVTLSNIMETVQNFSK
jgi:1-deoxy-D-xylulose-5-phosphate reductoisomerase